MKTTLEYYDIFPKILCTEREAEITIRPLGVHAAFDEKKKYRVKIIPMNETLLNCSDKGYEALDVQHCNENLQFRYRFTQEEQYVVLLQIQEDGVWTNCCELRVYSVKPDYFKLRPYRGDMHCHTCRSDGKEGPAIVAANYRKSGFDFLSITDHGQYEPAQEAIRAFSDIPMSFQLFAGEEVHPPKNNCHTVHFGIIQPVSFKIHFIRKQVSIDCSERSESICGKQDLIDSIIGNHSFRPVHHRCHHEGKGMFSGTQSVHFFYNHSTVFHREIKELF